MTKSTPEPSPGPVPIRRYRYSKWRWRVLVHVLDAIGAVVMGLWRLLCPIRSVDSPARLLLIQLDHLGDAVLTSPLLPRLRGRYPDAEIHVLASSSNQAVFRADPHVDRVIVASRNWFERRPGYFSIGQALLGMGLALRRDRYDIGIDVRGDVLSVLLMALAGIPRRVGWDMGGGGFLLTDVARWVPGRHEVQSRMALLDELTPRDDEPLRVAIHARDRDRMLVARLLFDAWPPAQRTATRRVLATLRVGGVSGRPTAGRIGRFAAEDDGEMLHGGRFGDESPLLAVHLGAGTAAKRWPAAHWRDVIGRFLNDGWRVVVVGGADDADAARRLLPHPNLRDFTGALSLTETAAMLERADLFLGSDSGPAHLAACAGIPSVILFSGTNRPHQWRPWSRRSLVIRGKVACRPCHQKVCPLADHPCMTSITPERVHRVARRWWSRLHHAESPHPPL